jgi:hypothetical protein
VNVSEKSLWKFKRCTHKMTGRSRGILIQRRMSEPFSYLSGCMGYFPLAAQLKLFYRLDQWIPRCRRMCCGLRIVL